MSFERTFKLATFLLLLSGFGAIQSAGGVDTATTFVYLCGVTAGWYVRPMGIPRKLQLLFILLFFLFFCFDVTALSSFGDATIRLLLLLSLFKLFTRETGRDYLLLYLIAFALVLIASTYTLSIIFLITLVVFLFFSILCFVLFENLGAYRTNPGADFAVSGYLQVTAVMTTLIVLLSIPIFLAVPRGSLGFFGASDANVAGFSTSVTLGDIGRILRNSEVVMRVRVNIDEKDLPAGLRWRGIALNHYDGGVWSSTRPTSRRLYSDSAGRYLVGTKRRQSEVLLEQSFFVEPFTSVVFGAPDPIQFFGFRSRRVTIWRDGNSSFLMRPRPREPFYYVVHSDLQSREQKIGQVAPPELPFAGRQIYLQLPAIDRRIPQLARQVTRTVDSAVDKALLLESFLRNEYAYTLDNPSGGVSDPLTDFLFNSRAGHCEYFATAQAVMLRTLGIPSRLVNGFRRGEFNSFGDYFIVRQSDAHSWVEAYFPGAGWIAFDPTPPIASMQGNSLSQLTGQLLDSLDVLWTEVITFDRFKQAGFFQSMRHSLERSWMGASMVLDGIVKEGIPDWQVWKAWAFRQRYLFLILGLSSVILVLVLRFRGSLRILWKTRILGRSGPEIAQDYYLEMLRVLARKGFVKSPFETPAEFVKRLGGTLHSELPRKLTEVYYKSRFGGVGVSEEELVLVRTSLKELR